MAKKKVSGKNSQALKRYVGMHLAGPKSDKTCLAVLEYYPKHKKIFLSRLHHKIGPEKNESADLRVFQILTINERPIDVLAVDAPLSWPKCIRCELQCPGYENCKEPEIQWMWAWHKRRGKIKKPNKIFSPYTQRCVELYLAQELEKPFFPSEAFGSNSAPLLARAYFLQRRLKMTPLEVYPPLSLWRMGRGLGLAKNTLNFAKQSIEGEENRAIILHKFVETGLVFIYEQDLRTMAQNAEAFDALICGLTGYLFDLGFCEPRPKGFPRREGWMAIPKRQINYSELLGS